MKRRGLLWERKKLQRRDDKACCPKKCLLEDEDEKLRLALRCVLPECCINQVEKKLVFLFGKVLLCRPAENSSTWASRLTNWLTAFCIDLRPTNPILSQPIKG